MPELLIQPERPRQARAAAPVRKHREDQAPERAVADAALRLALDLRTRGFEQRIVLHARWARRDARHAAEAGVDVPDEAVAVGLAAVAPQLHQVNAASGRIRLLAPQQIRRAGRQAETAVHAIVEEIAA